VTRPHTGSEASHEGQFSYCAVRDWPDGTFGNTYIPDPPMHDATPDILLIVRGQKRTEFEVRIRL
jgi:hypothetical protein